MNFDYYHIFYYVGKYQSFTKAAEALYMAQPNISRMMKQLENELDVQLFIRSKKGITLTKEGNELFEHVEKAFLQLELGQKKLESLKHMEIGSISIGVSEIALHEYLLPVLKDYKDLYPNIKIQIKTHTSKQALLALEEETCEVAIISSPMDIPEGFKEIILQDFQDILIAGSYYQSLTKQKIKLEELINYPLIMLKEDTTSYTFYKELFLSNQLPFNIDVEAVTTDQILPLVKHNLGLGFLPERFAKDELEKGNIVKINLDALIPKRTISLVYKEKGIRSKAMEQLLKLLVKS